MPTLPWRARIGLVLQTSHMPPELTVRELVERVREVLPQAARCRRDHRPCRADWQGEGPAGSLSGGQLRKLDVALALVGDPDLLFLDEPTTGFDPAARRQAWGMIEDLKPLGKTVFLTTHYMDEAEALADRVAVIAAGRIVAEGTPQTLGGREDAPAEIRFRRPPGMDPAALLGAAARAEDGWVSFRTPDPTRPCGLWRNGATRAARTCRAWRSGARPWKTSTWNWSGVSSDEHCDDGDARSSATSGR